MKSFYFILLLSVIRLDCNSQVDVVFTTIFSSNGVSNVLLRYVGQLKDATERKNSIFVGKSNNLNEAKKLKDFDLPVTGLAIYKDFLFVSVSKSSLLTDDSEVWRANITDLKNFEVDPKSWDRIISADGDFKLIVRLVGTDEYMYAGLEDGTILRWPVDERNRCQIFWKFEGSIIGIDYHFRHEKLYVATAFNLYSCSVGSSGICKQVAFPHEIQRLSAIKIAFNAVWLGIRKKYTYEFEHKGRYLSKELVGTWMMKCAIWKEDRVLRKKDCQFFENHPEFHSDGNVRIGSIDNTDKHIYFNVAEDTDGYGKKFWRCDPNNKTSCNLKISEPLDRFQWIDDFIIVS